MNIKRYAKDILAAVKGERYNVHESSIITLFNDSLVIRGTYIEGVNGGDWREHPNLVPDQGIRYFLNMLDSSTSKISAWYLAPFSGATSPAAAWTAANFTSNSTEITSTTEGYTEATRQAATLATTTAQNYIDNYASKATFTIATATTLSVTGLGLLSVSTRGGTTGTLVSATKFANARVLQDTDSWSVGYRTALTAS